MSPKIKTLVSLSLTAALLVSCSTTKSILSVPSALVSDISDSAKLVGLGSTSDSAQVHESELFYAPTPPVGVTHLVNELEPMDELVLAIPLHHLSRPNVTRTYADLIEVASRYIPVLVLTEENDPMSTALVKERLVMELTNRSPELVLSKVRFAASPLDTIWVRDFGPVFGRDRRGRVVVIDNSYRDIRAEAQSEREASLEDRERQTELRLQLLIGLERIVSAIERNQQTRKSSTDVSDISKDTNTNSADGLSNIGGAADLEDEQHVTVESSSYRIRKTA